MPHSSSRPTSRSARSGSRSPGEASSYEASNYQSLPTPPPKSRGPRQSFGSEDTLQVGGSFHRSGPPTESSGYGHHGYQETPLPTKQLLVLAFIALCEQTALNSISPYLPEMVASFPGIEVDEVGVYVGAIASAFALAQFLTNYFWGRLSDSIGRKPVVMMGTFFTAISLFGFGFSTKFWHAVLTQAVMGLLNGNQGVVSTCLGDITDKTNQSKAFTYLPVIYGLGGITGPIVGGFFADRGFANYPYLLPNLIASVLLLIDMAVSWIWLAESLEHVKTRPHFFKRISNYFSSWWQFVSSSHDPTFVRRRKRKQSTETSPLLADPAANESDEQNEDEEEGDDEDEDAEAHGVNGSARHATWSSNASKGMAVKWRRLGSVLSEIMPTRPPPEARDTTTILVLLTFLLFQFANVSFNSVYPIFAEAAEPVGRNLSPKVIGLSLSFAGGATIVFQVGLFNRLKHRMGNKVTWRASLFIFVIAFLMMPFVPYKGPDERHVRGGLAFGAWYGKEILYAFLGLVLLLKTIAAIGGLTSALLLITNSADSHAVLGSLNGLAQTLSAAGRAIGPLVSGALFSLSYRVGQKGEFLPFGLFAGVSLLGFVLSLFIKGDYLESQDGHDSNSGSESGSLAENSDDDNEHDDDDDDDHDMGDTERNAGSR